VAIQHLWPFIPKMPPSKKKKKQKTKKKKKCCVAWGWFGHPSIGCYFFFWFFCFLFWIFFKKNKIKYVMGLFRNKKGKGVELPQFESLGG
jgi:hypothetical protein